MPERKPRATTEPRETEPHPSLCHYVKLFVTNPQIHARQTADGEAYYKVNEPISYGLVKKHLKGELTLGFYATSPDGERVKWVCFDHDEEHGLYELAQLSQDLREREVPSLLEASRRGAHLWVFFDHAPTVAAREYALQVARERELDVEVYPRTEEGLSCVRGPLGVHRRSGQRYHFVEPETLKVVSGDVMGNLDYLTQAERVGTARLARELALKLREATRQSKSGPESEAWGEEKEGKNNNREHIVRLKEEIGDLRDFIGRFVDLNRKGRGSCPFHPPDEHPSFAVHETFWVCFHKVQESGKYLGGDVIDFWMRYRGVDFPTALEELARFTE